MELDLTENKSHRIALRQDQLAALRTCVPELTIAPVLGQPGCFELTPSQFVGRVEIVDLSLDIRPKIPIRSMLFMLAYSLDPKYWRNFYASFPAESGPLDAVSGAFARELTRAFSRGILRGYANRTESLATVRGRIIIGEQIRRWFGRLPPVECAYDEFTEDIIENRLLKAALRVLRNIHVRAGRTRAELAHAEAELENVGEQHFASKNVPEVSYTRLNERFRRPIELARLILHSTTVEVGRQGVSASAFIVDMSQVFELFVLTALRESCKLAPWSVPVRKERTSLDLGARLDLVPDLAFRDQGRVVGIGDVKYKWTPPVGIRHPDVYQVLAYAVAFDVPDAFLVYPAGEVTEADTHAVRNIGKSLHVLRLDLNLEPEQLLHAVDHLAYLIRTGADRRALE